MPNKQNKYDNTRTSKKNYIGPTQQYGVTKHAGKKSAFCWFFITQTYITMYGPENVYFVFF